MAEAQKGRDWATLAWGDDRADDYTGVVEANRAFAGLVGWARLCRAAGDKENEAVGLGELAQDAIVRYAMGRYRRYLYDSGRLTMPENADWQTRQQPSPWPYGHLTSFKCAGPQDDIEQVAEVDSFQVRTGTYAPVGDWRVSMRPYQVPFLFMVPEMGQFLGDHLKPECQRYLKVAEEFQPDWYLCWAEGDAGDRAQRQTHRSMRIRTSWPGRGSPARRPRACADTLTCRTWGWAITSTCTSWPRLRGRIGASRPWRKGCPNRRGSGSGTRRWPAHKTCWRSQRAR